MLAAPFGCPECDVQSGRKEHECEYFHKPSEPCSELLDMLGIQPAQFSGKHIGHNGRAVRVFRSVENAHHAAGSQTVALVSISRRHLYALMVGVPSLFGVPSLYCEIEPFSVNRRR